LSKINTQELDSNTINTKN